MSKIARRGKIRRFNPSEVFDFSKSLTGLIRGAQPVFTRADAATCASRVNNRGIVEAVSANIARLEHSISASSAAAGRTLTASNLAVKTEDLSVNVLWRTSNFVITPDALACPSGPKFLTKIAATAVADASSYETLAPDGAFSISFYVHVGTRSGLEFLIRNGNTAQAYLFSTFIDGVLSNPAWRADVLGGGIYRVSVLVTTGFNPGELLQVYYGATSGVTPGLYWYVSGMQITPGIALAPYFGNDSTSPVYVYDSGGLWLEKSSINYVFPSDNLSTWGNYVTGTAAGTVQVVNDPKYGPVIRLTKTAGAIGDRFGKSRAGITLAGRYTVSSMVKSNAAVTAGFANYVDLQRTGGGLLTIASPFSGLPVGVWTEFEGHPPAGTTTGAGGTCYFWLDGPIGSSADFTGYQIEPDEIKTSWILATNAFTTRAAESLVLTDITQLGVTVSAGGTVAFEWDEQYTIPANTFPGFGYRDPVSGDALGFFQVNGNVIFLSRTSAGSTSCQVAVTGGAGNRQRAVASWTAAGRIALSVNGSPVVTDTGPVPVVSQFNFDRLDMAYDSVLLRGAEFYPTPLSDADIQTLSALI